MMLKVYSFDYGTGIFTGERMLDIGDCDPRSPGVVLMPGNCTREPPPRCGKGLFTIWRDGQWIIVQRPSDFNLDADYYAHL